MTDAPQDPTPATELSESDAATLFNTLLTPEPEKKPERPRDATGKFVPAKEPEAPADPAPEEPVVEEEEAPPEVRMMKVKVDGVEMEMPEDEVRNGYSRTADYTRKTQGLAEERKKFVEQELEPVRQERAKYAALLVQMEDAVEALLPSREPDWGALRNTVTPEQFTQEWDQWRANSKRAEQIRTEQGRIADLHDKDERQRLTAQLAVEQEKLKAALPEWADAEKGKVLREDVVAYAKSLGWSDDDLAQVYDHRLLVLLNNARLWHQHLQSTPKVEDSNDRYVVGTNRIVNSEWKTF